MALLGKLIVNIDADLEGLRKQIRAAESVMRQSAKSLGALSSQLSTSISLPLAAIGVGAIKSAADMERLNSALSTTMAAAGRSSEAATKELEALRQAALAPGLDFEQAVKGSVRLQNVGFSAEKARNILVQLANAVAITGGQAQELDGVTRQFGQMIAKGRILQEDLSIIQENMPAVAVAMEKAFGTKSAEQLRNMGVSAEQFVDGVTKALSELPRVTGGLANSIVNAFSAVKLAAAQVGEVLNKQFGISERLNAFAAFLGELAQGFQALDSSTQSAILGVAAFALALGPAIKVGSLVVSAVGGISVAVATMRQAFAAVQAGGLVGWFQGLNSVMKANIFGVVVGVALAAAAAFALLSKETNAATKTQETLTTIQKQAADSVAAERVKIGLLVDTLKSETASREEKRAALAKLNEIAPTYFKGLDSEKLSVDALNIAYDKYIESLLRAARAKAAEEKLIELDKQALDLAEKRNAAAAAAANFKVPDRPQGFRANGTGDLQDSGTRAAALAIQAKANSDIQIKALDDQAAAVKFQMDALKGLIKANGELVPSEGNKAKAIQASIAATKEANKAAGVYREALADIQKEIDKAAVTGGDAFEAQATAIEAAIAKVLDAGFSKGSKEVQGLIEKMKALKASVETIGPLEPLAQLTPDAPVSQTAGVAPASPIEPVPVEVLDSYALLPEYLQVWQDKVNETQLVMDTFWESNGAAMQAASEAMVEFGSTIENSLADANTSWADFGQAAKAAIVGVIGQLIKLAVANAVTKAFANSPNPLLGAALAAIAGGLAAGLFKRLVGSAKFATGTLSAPGGRALVGEEGPELLNLPSSSGLRIPGKQTAAVLGALGRAEGQVRNVQQAAKNGLTVVGQNGPEYVNLPAGAQVIPATQTREVLQSLSRTVTARTSTTTNTVRSTINRDIAERIRRGLAVPAYAVGTLSARGGRSLVGERGPELVNLPSLSRVKLQTLQARKVMEAVSRQFSETRNSAAYSTLSDTVRNIATNNVVNNTALSDTVRNSLSNSEVNTASRRLSEAVQNLVTNNRVNNASTFDTVRNSLSNSAVNTASRSVSETVQNLVANNRVNNASTFDTVRNSLSNSVVNTASRSVSEAVRNLVTNNRTNNASTFDTVRNSLSNSAVNTASRSVSEAVRNLVNNSQVSRATLDISDTVRNSVANSRVNEATSTLSDVVRNTQVFNKLNIPQFAAGTRFAPGGLSLVGEYGPELVNLARGAQVIPAQPTERILENLQSGGGVQQVQVGGTFRIVGTDLVVVLEEATRKLNRVR